MSNQIVIQESKTVNQKRQKALIFAEIAVSIVVIVSALLFLTKIVPQSIMLHILYPSLALNILLNGFIMLGYGKKKIAIFDFVIVALIVIFYVISMFI